MLVSNVSKKAEQSWEYDIEIVFNRQKIVKLTIVDYYQKHEQHGITRELIRELVNKLDGEEFAARGQFGLRDIYVWDKISHKGKIYRLIFWFKDNTTNHLWIRNCYPIE